MSMGKFIVTVVDESFMHAGETVNCCQYVEDLKAIGNSRYRNNIVRREISDVINL